METEKKRILLVEESPGYTHLFEESFRRYAAGEFSLVHEKNMEEALKKLSEEKIDLILLDLVLLTDSGLETLARFQEADSSTPIVALTGHSKEKMTLYVPRWAPVTLSPKNMFWGTNLVNTLRYYTEQAVPFPA